MNWKIIWKSLSHRDMQKRILAVLGIILVFRILAEVPVPISDPQTLRQVLNNLFNSGNSPQLLGFINVLSGGALANFSILIAGLGPYINASIIMQMLTKAIPQLEALHKEGEYGQRKINQYTRLLTFPLAIAQSIGSIFLIRQAAETIGGIGNITANTSIMQWVVMIAALTGGSMLLMWLGELVTEQGIGNGISLLITIGIISRLPQTIGQVSNAFLNKNDRFKILGHTLPLDKKSAIIGFLFILAIIILTWLVVKLNEAARNVTINYAKRVQGNRAYGGVTTILPIKLVTAGVIPIIFAVAFLSVPSFAGQLLVNSHNTLFQHIGTDLSAWFQPPSLATFQQNGLEAYIYPVVYFSLVFLFTFFYTSVAFNSNEIAENLQKQGGFIEGIRSGKQTEKYLSHLINRLTLFGAISLGLLALIPIVGQIFLGTNIAIGGTSILILVSVSLQTLRSVESRALMITYDQYSESDFFVNMEPQDIKSPKKRRFSFLKFRPKS